MNKQQLLQHLQDIEWDNFEVKKAEKELPKSSWETVSAFANTSGGWLVLGVSQQGKKFEITGVENMEKLEQDLGNTLRSYSKFNTIINPYFKKYNIDGKKVLACFIPSSEVKPVYFNSLANTFIRTGSGDQRASEFEINALFRDQSFGTMSEKTVEGTSVESLNKSSYKRFREYLKWRNPDLRYNQMDDEEFNRRLKIVKDGKLTYGGLLFLGKNEEITDTFSDFRIDYFEIPGTSYSDTKVRYTYRIDEQENLWEYYFVLFQRLKIYANNPLIIGEMGIGHEDTKEIDALREALVNLLIHTDYFSPMKPRIRVFSNRIEFENPGSLPLPVEELMIIDESLPRNPVLAKFFRIAKLCESGGYGFNKMLEWKRQTGNDVTFESTIGKTKFTFMIDTTKAIRKESVANDTINDTENDTINDTTNDTENLTDNRKKIVKIMSRNPYITSKELSEMVGITPVNIRVNIMKLKNAGIICRDGANKGGKWIVIKPL
ncbi:MAG: putative DNA binding domain-containing protein [Tannerella sp.]|jgi:ATP-dependent DNA helicase RecG|nr:putative DNA binding domain-containing protein [Tannerella sp.]